MKGKKGIIIPIIIGVVLVVVGIILLLVLSPKKTNKELYTEAVQKSLGFFGNNSKEEYSEMIDDLKEKFNSDIYKVIVTGNSTQEEASSSNGQIELYFGKNQLYSKITSMDNDVLKEVEAILKEKIAYIKVNEIADKYFYVDLEEILKQVNTNDNSGITEKVLNYLVESFKDAIDNKNVVNEKEEITINNNIYNATKYSYSFDGISLYNAINSFAKKIKNDKEIFNEISKILKDSLKDYVDDTTFNLTQDDFNQMIDQLLESVKDVQSFGNLLTYSVYTYKDDVISRQITISIPSEQGSVPIRIADFIMTDSGKFYYKASISAMGMEVVKFEVKQTNDTTYNISVTSSNQELLKGTLINNDSSISLVIEPTNEYSGNSKLEFNYDKKEMTGSISIQQEFEKTSINFSIEKIDEFPEVDLSNSVPYTEMTEEEKEKFKEYFNVVEDSVYNDNYSRFKYEINEYDDFDNNSYELQGLAA